MSKKQHWMTLVFLSACLAIFSCFVSANLDARLTHHAETVYNQFAILRGIPHQIDGRSVEFPQFQARVLFPLLLEGMSKARLMSDSQAFICLRIATAFIAYLLFLLLCTRVEGLSLKIAAAGAGELAYMLVFTFNHGWEHPTDFLDVAFFSAFLWLSLQRRRLALLIVVILATLNHQTAAFAGVIWFSLWGVGRHPKPKWREAVYSAALLIGSYATSTAVKFWFGGHGQSTGYVINGWLTIPQFVTFLRHPEPYAWPILLIAMISPVSLWLWANRQAITGDLRQLLWASLWIVVLSSPIAFWAELRSVFLAPMVIAAFVATAAEARTDVTRVATLT